MSNYIAHRRECDGEEQSVEIHLRGVAKLSSDFAEKIGLPLHGEVLGLLHDLGKYSSAFQNYISSATGLLNQDEDENYVDYRRLKGKIDHSTAGSQLIWQVLSQQGPLGRIVGQVLALCLASHHSGLIDCLTSDPVHSIEDTFTKRMNKMDTRTHLGEVLDKADKTILAKIRKLLSQPKIIQDIQTWIRKIVLASPEKNDQSVVVQHQLGLLVRLLFSSLMLIVSTQPTSKALSRLNKECVVATFLGET